MVLILAILSLKHGWLAWLYYDIKDNRYPVLIIYKWGFFFFSKFQMLEGFCLNSSVLRQHTPFILFYYIFITSKRRWGSLLPSISLYLSMCTGTCAFMQLPYVLIVVFSPLNLCHCHLVLILLICCHFWCSWCWWECSHGIKGC